MDFLATSEGQLFVAVAVGLVAVGAAYVLFSSKKPKGFINFMVMYYIEADACPFVYVFFFGFCCGCTFLFLFFFSGFCLIACIELKGGLFSSGWILIWLQEGIFSSYVHVFDCKLITPCTILGFVLS